MQKTEGRSFKVFKPEELYGRKFISRKVMYELEELGASVLVFDSLRTSSGFLEGFFDFKKRQAWKKGEKYSEFPLYPMTKEAWDYQTTNKNGCEAWYMVLYGRLPEVEDFAERKPDLI